MIDQIINLRDTWDTALREYVCLLSDSVFLEIFIICYFPYCLERETDECYRRF